MIGARLVSSRRSLVRDPILNMDRETTPGPDAADKARHAKAARVVAVRVDIRLAADLDARREVLGALGLTEGSAS